MISSLKNRQSGLTKIVLGITYIMLMLACTGCAKEHSAEKDTQEFADESISEIYFPNVEEKVFAFSMEGANYSIPYLKISGCPKAQLEWKINYTLWKEACWIFDSAGPEDGIYCLFEDDGSPQIAGCYQYEHFLSVVYEFPYIERLPGKIEYAIVVDLFTGERILLRDVIKDAEKMKDMLLHYFDDDTREIRLFIDEEKAEEILLYGGMTEAETLNHNLSWHREIFGKMDSISYLFDTASFFMTEDEFVVLPGATYFEPLCFEWKNVSEGTLVDKITY